jgi:intraflagellar transport protein 122
MTDMVIQPLNGTQRVRIKCRDHIKKIAVFNNIAAVQLSSNVVVYQGLRGEKNSMQYKVKSRVPQTSECDLLLVTSQHFVLCHKRKLRCFDFQGSRYAQVQKSCHVDDGAGTVLAAEQLGSFSRPALVLKHSA